jgi:cysteine desulfurase
MRHYLDWNATAPMPESVVQAVAEAMREGFANASSLHREGRRCAELLRGARSALAELTGSREAEWILTAGATESLHAGILGTWLSRRDKGPIVASRGEHSAVLGALELARQLGAEVELVDLDADGRWSPDAVLHAVRDGASLVSLLWANNETGVVSDVPALAQELRRLRIPFLVDATQCLGRIPVDLSAVPVSMLALSGHKFGAPKGIGAFFLRTGTPWQPLLRGGGQERNRRAGTSNVPGAVGLEQALRELRSVPPGRHARFEAALKAAVPDAFIVGESAPRLPNTTCVILPGADSESLLSRLDTLGFSVSSGSACTSGKTDPSHVLLAMGIPEALAHCALRISTGPTTADDSLDHLLEVLPIEVERIRRLG